jgi:hypothetical protein
MNYTLSGCSWLPITPQEPVSHQKEPVLTQIKSGTDTYQSSHNEPIPQINSSQRITEFMDSNVESLLKEQIFLMKFILLFLGFMLLSNILSKKN